MDHYTDYSLEMETHTLPHRKTYCKCANLPLFLSSMLKKDFHKLALDTAAPNKPL